MDSIITVVLVDGETQDSLHAKFRKKIFVRHILSIKILTIMINLIIQRKVFTDNQSEFLKNVKL